MGVRRALPAREATRLYITGTPQEREGQFHEFDDRDPVARMAQALEESAVERLAVDQRPRRPAPGTGRAPRSTGRRRATATARG